MTHYSQKTSFKLNLFKKGKKNDQLVIPVFFPFMKSKEKMEKKVFDQLVKKNELGERREYGALMPTTLKLHLKGATR